jgi:hypothetical protein
MEGKVFGKGMEDKLPRICDQARHDLCKQDCQSRDMRQFLAAKNLMQWSKANKK